MTKSIQSNIATALRKVGSEECLDKAKTIENPSHSIHTLNFRNLALNSSDVIAIANCLNPKEENQHQLIRSISFSYNPLLGNSGAIALAKKLPKSLHEIGLVNCGISEEGGMELLNWMKNSTELKMACIEQNNFSEKLKNQFQQFGANNPQMVLVF